MNASTWRSAAKASLLILTIPLLALAQAQTQTNLAATNRAAEIKSPTPGPSEASKRARSLFIRTYCPLRVIEGQLYDWTEFIVQLVKNDKFPPGYGIFRLNGTVLSVTAEGVLIEPSWSLQDVFFLKNWNGQAGAIDGTAVDAVAFRSGSYSYISASGAQKTVAKYDAGRCFNPSLDHFETKIVLRGAGPEELPVTDWDRL